MALAKWRGSASLIIAARNNLKNSQITNNTDYGILMADRTATGSFACSSVFPGGVHENIDESPQWLNLFKKFGVPNERLSQLTVKGKSRPELFKKSSETSMHREISLRIAALRETFEEVGVLIVRKEDSFKSETACATVHTDFDCSYWQKKVHEDASQFMKMCQELKVIPDLWNLHEWSTWMSPASFKQQFQTVLYVVGLEEKPQLCVDSTELIGSSWRSPHDYLNEYHKKKILLPPPQFYELARLCNFTTLSELLEFAKDRANDNGMVLLLGIHYQCTDGTIFVLPGDDMYPDDPFAIGSSVKINKTMEEFRENYKNFNRVEWTGTTQIVINVPNSDGQAVPKFSILNNQKETLIDQSAS